MPRNKTTKKKFVGVETLKHDDKRKNIPTAEYQSLLHDEEKSPIQLAYAQHVIVVPGYGLAVAQAHPVRDA